MSLNLQEARNILLVPPQQNMLAFISPSPVTRTKDKCFLSKVRERSFWDESMVLCKTYMKFLLFIGVISNGICARFFFFFFFFNPLEIILVCINCVTFRATVAGWDSLLDLSCATAVPFFGKGTGSKQSALTVRSTWPNSRGCFWIVVPFPLPSGCPFSSSVKNRSRKHH